LSRTAAVLGSPIGHSLSPALHRAAYLALGLTDWTYRAVECDEQGLAELLADAGPEVAGYSCTMPLKRAVLAVATSVSEHAAAIGAGNTLLPTADGWRAENTDWIGIRDALAARAITVAGRHVALLGAGGTAQAALAALVGAGKVTALVRDPARTGELRATAQRLAMTIEIAPLTQGQSLTGAGLVISTLPAGAADGLDQRWRPDQGVLDVVYHPWPTALAEAAGRDGAKVISGASMLLFQAAAQVELMTGRAAPVEAMRAALLAAAPGCGG
jgi:shikimate dehydrogenase